MEDPQQELLEELLVIETIVKENPCRMETGLIRSLKHVVQMFLGKYCIEGASREDVARYLQRDVRTITRWKQQYHDFPQARHNGHKEVTYDWADVVKWKLRHKDLYEEQ